jgi:penicillin-binding protein 1C
MQIARMLERKERTFASKGAEVFRSLQLEWRYSKRELLTMYLSMIPLGGNIEGLQSGAMLYYETPLDRLPLSRLADLILIPADPNGRRPDRFPAVLQVERQRAAARWRAAGLVAEDDSLQLDVAPSAASRVEFPRHAEHFSLRVRAAASGEARVRSSLDLSMQKRVESKLATHLREWRQRGVRNAAAIVLDNRTREVRVYAGNVGAVDDPTGGDVDAVRALRSPGSTLKPFLYAMLMDRGVLTRRTVLLDTPYDAEGFAADNYDGTFSGPVYADDALRRSLNVPMIRLLRQTGTAGFLDFLSQAGIRSLARQRPRLGLSMILGGCGVTLEELAGAYAVFPGGGRYSPPSYRVEAKNGRDGSGVCSPAAAFMITEILSGLDRPDLPSTAASSLHLPVVAFKTGTSYGRRDAWCLGYSAEYTAGVWVGNVDNEGNPELMGSLAATPLLVEILNLLTTPGLKRIMAPPPDAGLRLVCARSGQIPTPRCAFQIEDSYSRSRTLSQPCQLCREFLVSPDASLSYCPSCVADFPYRVAVYEDFPPDLLAFWSHTGRQVRLPPPHNPACTRVFGGEGPGIVSPSEGMIYYLVSDRQRLCLRARSGGEVREHIWYLDDRYVGRTGGTEPLFIDVSHGEHAVACVDDRGRLSRVRIRVVRVS